MNANTKSTHPKTFGQTRRMRLILWHMAQKYKLWPGKKKTFLWYKTDDKTVSSHYGAWLRHGTEWSDNKKTSDSYGLWLRNGTEWSDNKKTSDSYGLWLRNGTERSDNKETSNSYGLWHGVARQQENI